MNADDAKGHGANIVALWVCIAITAFSLWLRNGFPISAIASANTDDFLYIRLAAALRRAHWLGAYDQLILAKGPVFSGFVAVISLFHTPLKIAEQGVYLAAAGGLSFAAFKLSGHRALGVVLFAALAFNPVLWSASLSRVVRDGLYIGLSVAVLAAFAILWTRPLAGGRNTVLGALFTGALAAAFWLTREEGVWLAPALAIFGGIVLVSFVQRAALIRSTLIAAGATAGCVLLVATINFAVYGVFADVEFRAPGFLSGYGALTRVKHESWRPYVMVPAEVREKIYRVSPAAAELRPHLEGENGQQWKRTGCALQPDVPCTDILGGWFVWAVRDAVALAGYARSGGEAEAFYRRLGAEINAACDDGRLSCIAARASVAPPFRGSYLTDALKAAPRLLSLLLTFGREELVTLPTTGSPQRLAQFRALVGPIEMPPSTAPITRIFGWLAAYGAPPTLFVLDATGAPSGQVEVTRAPDIDRVLPREGFTAQLFTLYPACPQLDCTVVLKLGDGSEHPIPLKALGGVPPENRAYVLNIDDVERPVNGISTEVAERIALPQGIARGIAAGYARLALPLFGLGVAGLLLGLWVFRTQPPTFVLAGLAAASAAVVATRIALLSYIQVSTFPTANLVYLSAASPFVIITAVIGIWVGVKAVRFKMRG